METVHESAPAKTEPTPWARTALAALLWIALYYVIEPLYSNAAGMAPVLQALVEKGAALGTALAFMMAVVGVPGVRQLLPPVHWDAPHGARRQKLTDMVWRSGSKGQEVGLRTLTPPNPFKALVIQGRFVSL